MNKRSKVLLFILLAFVVITFLSLVGEEKDNNNDEALEYFEEEITNPENELDPLNTNVDNNVLLIKIALKTEDVIQKVFNIFIYLLKNITESII